MAANIISAQRLRELLNYDSETGVFTWAIACGQRAKSGAVAGSPHKDGYRQVKINSKAYLSHRLAWLYIHGSWPTQQIDHINGIRDDNRFENLRDVSSQENTHNEHGLRASNKSGVSGVYWHKKASKWMAYISKNCKRQHLGLFDNIEDAIAVRRTAKIALHPTCPSR